jgi:hypothetical protein
MLKKFLVLFALSALAVFSCLPPAQGNNNGDNLGLRAASASGVSIAAGSSSAVGSFEADEYYSGGSTYHNTATVDVSQITTNPPPAALFNNERYGAMSYTIPNLTAGAAYTVTLYFAETYLSGSGQRLFSVSINNNTVLSNFDIYASAGGRNKAIARSFSATANSSGQIVIQFISGTQNPKINGIAIVLSGSTTTLSVSPTTLTLAAAANSTGTFTVTSNTSWTVSSSQSWLTASPTSGSNNGTVTVTAQQNTGSSARTATVTVSATGAASQTVTVTQNAATTTTLSVSPTTLTLAAAANSTGTFTVTSNTSWTVSSSQSWLTASPTSGSNNGTVTVTAQQNTGSSARTATVTVSATGAASQTVTVTQNGAGGGCTIPPMPSYSSLPTNSYLPDPFTFMDGSRMTSKSQWTCRRAEIAAEAQEFELGYKPDTPYSATTGSFSGNSLTVTVTDNGKTISFSCSISYPSTGSKPYPALIGIGGSSLNNSVLSSLGVAIITFPNDSVAQQNSSSSRGIGKFYDMYGSGHSAGALMAWAWGVSRLIDAIEKTPAANIDPARLGVTGCSRNGKGALICGAFDERIKLTIPQESGSGGAASWRVSDWQKAQGQNVQTLSEIVGENVWFRSNFSQFSSTATKLPFDHHSIEALCAPRALLVIENTSMEWLGNVSTWTTGNVAHYVWEALGIPDMMGFSQVGHSNHCGFPSSQQPEVTAYVQKFLVGGGTGNTTIMKTDGNLTYDKAKWVNWTVPTLN